MKPDKPGTLDAFERAHLRDPADQSHRLHRYPAPDGFEDVLRRCWLPIWSVPEGTAVQQVLQYPVALLVVTDEYARFYGVATGLSTTELAGVGWGFGLLLQPAAGQALTGDPMDRWTDRHAEVAEALGDRGRDYASAVRAALSADPQELGGHRRAIDAAEDLLRPLLPVDEEGTLINALVEAVETDPTIRQVADICERFALSERSLQRLCQRRLGLTPRWLIQRRRLHEAVASLRTGGSTLAAVAAELGYADQAHFTRDFHAVTGITPGRFALRHA